MRLFRAALFLGGLFVLALSFGYIFQVPAVTRMWPWEDGQMSYLFIGSILAAVSAAALWIGWSGELSALPAGTLNVFVFAGMSSFYFFQLVLRDGRVDLLPFGFVTLLMAVSSIVPFLWSRQLPVTDTRPTPVLVRVSFGIFIISLILAGGALILRQPIFPWGLNPDSSILFGCIFIGDAFYFLYGLLYPRWSNAQGQLLSFLAYDLVLIGPFLALFGSVTPEQRVSLIAYVAVLVYSGALAVYFLFIHPETRRWRRT